MDVAWRCAAGLLVLLAPLVVISSALAPAAQAPQRKPAADYSDPKATFRAYIEALRNRDIQAAKQCWVIAADDQSGSVDMLVGLWIAMRQINHVAEQKFGTEGLDAVLKGWRRDDLSDSALDLAKKRLEQAEVKRIDHSATLQFHWQEGDGVVRPVFAFGEDPIPFRQVNGEWKIDASKMAESEQGSDAFANSSWGKLVRDQITIMNEAVAWMEQGKLKTAAELNQFIESKLSALKQKYKEAKRPQTPRDQ